MSLVPINTSWVPSICLWGIALLWLIGALIYWFKSKKKPQVEQKAKKQLKLDLGKLLLNGKDILVDLEKMDARVDSLKAVSTENKFGIWYKTVSAALQDTPFDQLWDGTKVGVDYHRTARKADYIEACRSGLDRLEYIKQLMLDMDGSQTG